MDKSDDSSAIERSEHRVSEQAVAHLVDRFYAKVRQDPQLEYVIDNAIVGDWAGHLARMRAFWAAAISSDSSDRRGPVYAHPQLSGMDQALIARWITLFDETCGEVFDDQLASIFREKASQIGGRLQAAFSAEGARSQPEVNL